MCTLLTVKVMTKLLRTPGSLLCTKVHMSIKSKSHYDTLNVSPNATHNEIKSAYYKLSLQYHPDKNKTEAAKKMFQEISNAYEVIGSYDARKDYDRRITVKQRSSKDARYQAQEPTTGFATAPPPPGTKIYDFDEWTRMHYKMTFNETRRRRFAYQEYKKERLRSAKSAQDASLTFLLSAVFTSILLIYVSFINKANDVDLPLRKSDDHKK